MPYLADLHVHSRFSRATSRECRLEGFCAWAQRKGISVLATGDFTHPEWSAELKEKLADPGNGLLKLRPQYQADADANVPAACRQDVSFILNTEISCIYKRDGVTRKVHALVFAPDFTATDAITAALARIGNLKADGRPILGLDCRDLLHIVLNAAPDAWLVPAHIWTPWFSMLGAKSGFNSLAECFDDLASEIFAAETGLSSDIPMNRLVSSLDGLALISNSDAHSPANLGRNATVFLGTPSYGAIRQALKTRSPAEFGGTLDLFPEEGKYHLDGHRACQVRLTPAQSMELNNLCPVCGKPLVLGVLHRVMELADRTAATLPPNPIPFTYVIPLPELLAEINHCAATTKLVARKYETLLGKYGPEDHILRTADLADLQKHDPLLAEAITRVRQQKVLRQAGYDGEYGRITVFQDDEMSRILRQGLLISPPPPAATPANGLPAAGGAALVHENTAPPYHDSAQPGRYDLPPLPKTGTTSRQTTAPRQLELFPDPAAELLTDLTVAQRDAATDTASPVVIIAGPGAGKTRTLTRRMAWQVASGAVRPEQVLAVTFTNRAAQEMQQRLRDLLGTHSEQIRVGTFHHFCLSLIRQHHDALKLSADFELWDDEQTELWLARHRNLPPEQIASLLLDPNACQEMLQCLLDNNRLGLQLLVPAAITLLETHPAIITQLNLKTICVDEWQDVSADQYRLVKTLAQTAASLCVIGDPDQSIYAFRGASNQFFQQLKDDFPGGRTHHLLHNFRSDAHIVQAANCLLADARRDSSQKAMPARGGIHRLRFHRAPTPAAEAEYIAQEIERWMGGVAHFSMDSQRVTDTAGNAALALSDIAILVRLKALVKPIAEAVARLGLPVFTPEIHGPDRVTSTFLRKAGRLSPLHRQEPANLASVAILKAVTPRHETETQALNRLKHDLEQFPGTLNDFLDQRILSTPADKVAQRGQRLTVMTCHAAKGLEFPLVFVAAAEDRFFPFEEGKIVNPEEERRLLYVAMTRAERVLYLTSAARRSCFGKMTETEPSRFLAKIPDELRDHPPEPPVNRRGKRTGQQPLLPGFP